MEYLSLIFSINFVYIIVFTIYIFINHAKTSKIMKRVHPRYSGKITSSSDGYKIIYSYFKSKELTKEERNFLRIQVTLSIISHILWFYLMFELFKTFIQSSHK